MPPTKRDSNLSKIIEILEHNHRHELQGLKAIFDQNDQIIDLLMELIGSPTPPDQAKIDALTLRVKTVKEALSKAIVVPVPVV